MVVFEMEDAGAVHSQRSIGLSYNIERLHSFDEGCDRSAYLEGNTRQEIASLATSHSSPPNELFGTLHSWT